MNTSENGKLCNSVKRFTDGLPWIATEEDVHRHWSGGRNGKWFRCYLCGHKFVVGDVVRWQFTNDVKGAAGNPLVCQTCDGSKDQIVEKWKQMYAESEGRMWWFCKDDQ